MATKKTTTPRKAKTAQEAEDARLKASQAEAAFEIIRQGVERPDTLPESIVLAQELAREVDKASRNDHHQYKYASSEDVLKEANRSLSPAGLSFFPTSYEPDWKAAPPEMHCTYTLMHWKGGVLTFTSSTAMISGKGKPEDKAEATAKTYDIAYMLRGLCLLARVEKGTEVDQRKDDDYHPMSQSREEQNREARRKAVASVRMSEIAEIKGKDWCNTVVGGRPRETVDDYEALVGILEYNLAKEEQITTKPATFDSSKEPINPDGDKPATHEQIATYWKEISNSAITLDEAAADLKTVYGSEMAADLTQDQLKAATKRLLLKIASDNYVKKDDSDTPWDPSLDVQM